MRFWDFFSSMRSQKDDKLWSTIPRDSFVGSVRMEDDKNRWQPLTVNGIASLATSSLGLSRAFCFKLGLTLSRNSARAPTALLSQ